MLELALLGLLKERPLHGYDLRKRLREDFGSLANLSFGSLYPALARLEANGAVRAVIPAERARADIEAPLPLTGSLGGERASLVARRATAKAAAALGGRGTRARKVYEITHRGEELFEQLLESTEGDEDGRTFMLKLAFARHLSPAARVRLLERRRLQLADRLQHASRSLAKPARALDRYEHSLAEHARETAASDLAWIEGLLDHERSSLQSWGPVREEADSETTADSYRAEAAAVGTTGTTAGRDRQ
ncbi:MAG: putative transcriptional regulator [Acidimicrobiaceae bacterium]|nr:putative transcriptional regulator [Acidimicrobiaceae bacterium]